MSDTKRIERRIMWAGGATSILVLMASAFELFAWDFPIHVRLPLRIASIVVFAVLYRRIVAACKQLELIQHAANLARQAAADTRRAGRAARAFVAREIIKPSRHALRRMRMQAAGGRVTRAAKSQRWALYGNLCWVCHAPATHSDHVIAVARGGANWPANIRPACRRCNCSKGARDWRQVAATARGLPVPGRLP